MTAVRVCEPLIQLNEQQLIPIQVGPSNVNVNFYPAQNLSASNTVIVAQIPSKDVVIDRRAYLNVRGRLNFTGRVPAVAGPPVVVGPPVKLLNEGTDCFRARPLQQVMQSQTCQINDATTSLTYSYKNNLADALFRIHRGTEASAGYDGGSPTAVDTVCEYTNFARTNRNPLGSYSDAVFTDESACNRGSRNFTVVSQTVGNVVTDGYVAASAIVDFDLYELLAVDPFNTTDASARGLSNITQIQITIQWGRFDYAWSHNDASGAFIDSITLQNDSFSLVNLWLKMVTLPVHMPKPLELVYNTSNINYYQTQTSSNVAQESGKQFRITSQNISTATVPKLIMIYACKYLPTYTDANSYCALVYDSPLSISYMNKPSLLSNLNSFELWKLSRSNGSTQSWAEFSGNDVQGFDFSGTGTTPAPTPASARQKSLCGPIILIDPAKDLSMDGFTTDGSPIQNQLTVSCSFTNQSTKSYVPVMIVTTIEPSVMIIHSNSSIEMRAGLATKAMVEEAIKSDFVYVQNPRVQECENGFRAGFSFRNLLSSIKGVYDKASPYIKKAIEHAPEVVDIYEKVKGGKVMSRENLKGRMLRQYGQ